MNHMSEEEFIDLIVKEYEEWCGYHGECYFTSNDNTDEELFEFVMCQVPINGTTIEQMDDDDFAKWQKFFYKCNKDKFTSTIDDYLHPYDPWTEHRKDWLGL